MTAALKTSRDHTRLLNFLCIAFCVILIIMQFLPFWGCYNCKTCGEGKVISIFQYTWFANNHKSGLTTVLQDYYIPDFKAMDVVATHALALFFGLASIFFCIKAPRKNSSFLFPFIAGVSSILGFLTQPAYRMGSLWPAHLAVGVLLTVCACAVWISRFLVAYRKAKAEIAAEM